MKINLIDYGIACRIGDEIFINKKIKEKYPKLYYEILRHEQAHSSGYSKKDILIDLRGKYIYSKKDYYKFIITTPRSWSEFSPLGYYNKKTVFNITMIFVWIFIGIMIGLILKLIFYLK